MTSQTQTATTATTAAASATAASSSPDPYADERRELLAALAKHRALFLGTVEGLDDEQAATRTTVSELTLGGLVKHVTAMEREWASFVVDGPRGGPTTDWASVDWSNPPAEVLAFQAQFRMDGASLADLLSDHATAAAATDEVVRTVDLAATQPLPAAPWFAPGEAWSARRTVVHLLTEIAQHAGHADILREAIDGRKSMG